MAADTWIDAEAIEQKAQRRNREARKIAALNESSAEWLDTMDRLNHFRAQWDRIIKEPRRSG